MYARAACADSCITSPKLARNGHLALAVQHLNFGCQNASAHFGPRQARDQADFALLVNLGIAEPRHAQEFADARAP